VVPTQGLHVGLAVGVAMCALQFAYDYAKIQLTAIALVPPLASTMLPQSTQQVLALFRGNMAAISITGAHQGCNATCNDIHDFECPWSHSLSAPPQCTTAHAALDAWFGTDG
jgi:hypothetical protein